MREDEAYQYIRELSRRKGQCLWPGSASYLLAQQEERHD